jgi:glycosyltransferase involved in cell wall biosynthesis
MVFGHANPMSRAAEINERSQAAHVVELSRALSRRGHEVRIYARRDTPVHPSEKPLTPIGDDVVVEYVSAGPARPLSTDELLPNLGDLGRELAKRWSEGPFRPDLVHAHVWMSGLAALTATAEDRIPIVVTYHALGAVERRFHRDAGPKSRVGLERTLGNMADRVIALCEDEVSELGRFGVHRADTVIVPSGVDVSLFTPGPSVEDGVPRVLAVGRLTERNGFADLVAAMPLVPEAELVIAGGPDPKDLDRDPAAVRLRRLAERARVADRVRLVGRVPRADMPGWYRSAAVVACPTLYGPTPLVPLEAMACGVPVVAYGTGGLAESVIDGVTGVVLPGRDIRELAGALRALLRDNVRRMSLSSAAVDRVQSRFTWDRAAFDTERVYLGLHGPVETEEAVEEDEAFTEMSI